MKIRSSVIASELRAHLPYSIGSVLLALTIVAVFTLWIGGDRQAFDTISRVSYHVTHPLHILLSAAATAAMFWGYQRRFWKTVLVSLLASVLLCSLSDFLIPFAGGLLYKSDLAAHVCIIEHAGLVLPFLFAGILVGIAARRSVERSTVLSHTGHVIVSSLASVLYLAAFSGPEWIGFLPVVIATVFFAVLIPCCLSDIVVPLLFVDGEHLESCLCHHHGKQAAHAEHPAGGGSAPADTPQKRVKSRSHG